MGLLSKAISIQVITGKSGGLMRKLTVCSTRIGKEHASGASRTESRLAGSGLLHKSLLLLSLDREEKSDSESLIIVSDTPHINRLLEKINRLTQDFSYFPSLYSLLVKEFSLPKSAFFLYNGLRSSFTPWFSRGLDPALSCDLEFTEQQWRKTISASFQLESGRQLFPALKRELPQPLYHVPFVHRGTLEGSLLVSNFALPPQHRDVINSFFRRLSSMAGTAISTIMKTLNSLSRPERLFPSPETALPALLESGSARPETFFVINLPLTPLLETLKSKYGFCNRLRFREIILYAVNSFFSHLGAATPHGEENIILVLKSSQCFSMQLLCVTLSQLITDVFKGLFFDKPALAASRVFEYPACGMKPLEIAAAL